MWPYCSFWSLPLILNLAVTGDPSLPVFYSFVITNILGYGAGSNYSSAPMKVFLSLTTELVKIQPFVDQENCWIKVLILLSSREWVSDDF